MRILQEEYAKDKHYALLKDDLHQTARALQDAYNNLENVVDPDLIDCYIYELNSVQMRYKFLLASIKKNGTFPVISGTSYRKEASMQRSLLICQVPGSFPPDHLFHMCTLHTPAGYFSSSAQRYLSLPPCKNSDIISEAFFLHFQSPSDSVYTLLPQGNPYRKHKSGKDFWRCHRKNPVSALTHQWNSVLSSEPP